MSKEGGTIVESSDLMNFQVQYFPRWAKDELSDMAKRMGISTKTLLVMIAKKSNDIQKFLEK